MVNDQIVKVCGMRDGDNISQLENLPIDMIGFIFYNKSPRLITEMPSYMPQKAKRVGVFVNEEKQSIITYADRFDLDYIQLHGNESADYCKALRSLEYKVIKAFSISSAKDLENIYEYEPHCDLFLFDTKCRNYGGSGNQFDWNILQTYKGKKGFLLSGGINLYSTRALKEFSHPRLIGYDLNSRFEISPGNKDVNRIKEFIEKLQHK